MNIFQTCHNTSDAVPLYLPQQLYLKPTARLNVSVQLPVKKMGKSISNLELSEQLRSIIKPYNFLFLKVIATNLEFIRFEAEIDDKTKLDDVLNKLDKKTLKLKEFTELLKIRASKSKVHFPTRHEWDTFFHEAKNMNEMKPGERPDTIHISNLPIKWFVPLHLMNDNGLKPSEKIFYRVFQKFGSIRCIDIPISDPYRNKMKTDVSGLQTFSFNEEHFFEGYVQFKDYIGFSKAMDALRGMKLLHKEEDVTYGINIIVDYDRTKHLSEASIRRREIVRERLIRKDIVKEEHKKLKKEEEDKIKEDERKQKIDEKIAKEQRRREREEKRKAKILAKLKVNSTDEINDKIAKEEKKLLKVQRKLEAIRLVEALFQRIKVKYEKNVNAKLTRGDEDEVILIIILQFSTSNSFQLTRMKNVSELEVHQQKEKLNRVIEGRVILKTLLLGDQFNRKRSSSSESSGTDKGKRKKPDFVMDPSNIHNDWGGYLPDSNFFGCAAYPNSRLGGPSHYYPPQIRGREDVIEEGLEVEKVIHTHLSCKNSITDISKSFFMKTMIVHVVLTVNLLPDHIQDIELDPDLDQDIDLGLGLALDQEEDADPALAVLHLISTEDLHIDVLELVVNQKIVNVKRETNQDLRAIDRLIAQSLYLPVV
ncbi:hypothetical protein FQR65_LT04943 [Abscondita terminalis]|nr:hypothetical protein FQR65_LT04943 [Abscondita terminalis]